MVAHKNETFLDKLKLLMEFTGVEWEDYDRILLANSSTKNDMRQWTYQFCTEFGWF